MAANSKDYPNNLIRKVMNDNSMIPSQEQVDGIKKMLTLLNEEENDAISKRFFQGLTFKKISEEYGITLMQARRRVEIAVRKLRRREIRMYIDSNADNASDKL